MSIHIDMTMKTYDKEKFSQIMINKPLKDELDSFSDEIKRKKRTWYVSYNEIISFLVKAYRKSMLVYSLDEKLLIASKLKDVKVVKTHPLQPKRIVSFSLE